MSGLRFLAVDDDPVFRLVLQGYMHRIGYDNLVSAATGAQALALLSRQSQPFDCILLDIEMPGMNGIELCRQIRAVPVYRHTPIIMITSLAAKKYVEQAFAAGATDYFTKPIDEVELTARLGMMARLVAERGRSSAFKLELESWSDLPKLRLDFGDPIAVGRADWMVEYLALENQLLTFGRLKLHNYAAIAIRVVNAAEAFAATDHLGYMDYMANVAAAIADALKTHPFVLAHAGHGEFVCVTDRAANLDPEELTSTIAASLLEFEDMFETLDLPLPEVQVGLPQTAGMFTQTSVAGLLERARRAVRSDNFGGQRQLALA